MAGLAGGRSTTLVTGRRILWNATHEMHIGPYAGGINTYSDVSEIADNEMPDCVNFDIGLDGSLVSRPPWRLFNSVSGTSSGSSSSLDPNFQLLLGSWTYNSVPYVFYYSDVANGASGPGWSLVSVGPFGFGSVTGGTGKFSKAVRYADKVYLIPDVTNADDNGIEFDFSTMTATSVPLKRGYACVVYKDRLWITGRRGLTPESRLFFSDPGNMKSFQATSFFDINPGDGDATQDITVYQDNLVIFKDSATYVLTFNTNPAQAALQVVNTDIGVSGPRCVVPFENSVFILQYNTVYEMVNYDFTKVSVKVPFVYDTTVPAAPTVPNGLFTWKDPIWLSRIGDRIIARFYNRLYVYHLRLRSWTRWDSSDLNVRYLGYIIQVDNTNTTLRPGYNTYLATSVLNTQYDTLNTGPIAGWRNYQKFLAFDDRYEGTYRENGQTSAVPQDIVSTMLTKTFDLGYTHRFKHLMQWGIDVITGRDITGSAIPSAVNYVATWDQLANYQWHQLNTWQFPLFTVPSVTVTQPVGSGLNRRFIRIAKSLRFRLIQWQVTMTYSGNTTDGPAKLYSITALLQARQLVPKAVN